MAGSLTKDSKNNWILKTDQGTSIKAKVIIVAGGGGSFVPKKPPIAEIEKFEDLGFIKYSIRRMGEKTKRNQ